MKVEDKRSNDQKPISSDSRLIYEILYEGKDNFRKLFEFSPVPTIIINLYTGEIINANQAFTDLYRVKVTEMIGRNVRSILISSDVFSKSIYEFTSRGQIRNLEIEIINETKDILKVSIDAKPIEYFDKACVLITLTDVSRYKENENAFKAAQSKIDQTNQSKWSTVKAILSEIDSQLVDFTATDGNVEKSSEDSMISQLSTKRYDALAFSESLVLETKEWLTMESGDFKLNKERFNIRQTIGEVHRLFQELMHDKRLEIVYHYEGIITNEVLGDEGRFKHLLITFFSSGLKYVKCETLYVHITFEDLSDGDMRLIVEIENNSDGYEFERFINEGNDMIFSVHKEKINDTLESIDHAISMFILKEMKGELVESINYFGNHMIQLNLRFQVPTSIGELLDVRQHLQSVERKVDRSIGTDNRMDRILLISDSSVNRIAVDAILSRKGYDVTLTKNYREGMKALGRNVNQYGMVLINSSDEYRMDEMVASMREQDMLDHLAIGVMIYDGENFDGLHRRGLIQGILKKPVEAKTLSIMVNKVMTGRVRSEQVYSEIENQVFLFNDGRALGTIDDKERVQSKNILNNRDAEQIDIKLNSLIKHSKGDKRLYNDFLKYLADYNFKAVEMCDDFLYEYDDLIDPVSQKKIKALIVQLKYDEIHELVKKIFGNEG